MEAEHDLPQDLLQSLNDVEGFDEKSFVAVHESGEQVVSVRFNPMKVKPAVKMQEIFAGSEKIPWSCYGYYLPSRPSFTFDPLLHAGVYYVQEASGMFIEQCLTANADTGKPLKVLDLCAAPGGKSTLLQSLISRDSLLVSNEVIKTRVNVLTENLTKWGGANVVVTNNDPRDFSRLANFFDVMVIDAPCSGSGLFRRDPEAIDEWSEEAVIACSLRQQRILNDAYGALKRGGLLIYSTCSYSKEEDENICDWLMDNYDVTTLQVSTEEQWSIVETQSDKHQAYGYRFFPDKLKGEGFFVACFRKNDGDESAAKPKKSKLMRLPNTDHDVVKRWISDQVRNAFFELGADIFAFPDMLVDDLESVQSSLYVKKAGIILGRKVKNELVPSHDLAVSEIVAENLLSISLNLDQSIQYLRKEEVTISSEEKGWALVTYEGYNLGWIKLLGRRVNNYYPKEWRILKGGNK